VKRAISVRVGHKRGLSIPAQHRSSATSRVTACRLTSAPNSGRLAPVRPTFPGRLPARGLARPRMAGSVSFLQELIRIPPVGRRHRNASPIASISRSAEGSPPCCALEFQAGGVVLFVGWRVGAERRGESGWSSGWRRRFCFRSTGDRRAERWASATPARNSMVTGRSCDLSMKPPSSFLATCRHRRLDSAV